MKLMRDGTLKNSKKEKTKTIGMQIMSRLKKKKQLPKGDVYWHSPNSL
jgi:hypothetical protein